MGKHFSLLGKVALLVSLVGGTAFAGEPVLVNGGFETGDYSGWTLREGRPAYFGTWGIARHGETINRYQAVFDYCDAMMVQENSAGLPHTYEATEGGLMALQLQNGGQEHRMYQDVVLPDYARALSWDMFYKNHAGSFGPDQCIAVHIRDLSDNVLETLFLTDGTQPQEIPMTHFVYDISAYAGKAVRIDVDMKVYRNFLDAGFDNFRVELADVQAPPGWSRKNRGKKVGWGDAAMPPGLAKKGKTPKGFDQGDKTGWQKEAGTP
ncbi:hypothetical protein G3N55_09230 [Dissulfurirhabdus thermomarina]|uniref:Uncharacterized protein n=1 Tax=Dissulfurirhabdus thermomarina TaxID=1765737 RepID=A0A6N9TP14_DISTH|nr:hypothetical protein [Dissulfurirhabdus thermomarina]NDY43022.1 hypothetical protein [Dissulfurirhabdus thermomarina]NMX22890.1 hypothetical protein [Dissulfurirhabdus thermomarina]